MLTLLAQRIVSRLATSSTVRGITRARVVTEPSVIPFQTRRTFLTGTPRLLFAAAAEKKTTAKKKTTATKPTKGATKNTGAGAKKKATKKAGATKAKAKPKRKLAAAKKPVVKKKPPKSEKPVKPTRAYTAPCPLCKSKLTDFISYSHNFAQSHP